MSNSKLTTVPSALAVTNDASIPVICGALTPTEVGLAWYRCLTFHLCPLEVSTSVTPWWQRTWTPTILPLGGQLDVVGVGEAMLLLQTNPPENLVEARHLLVDVAGAELNAVAAVARAVGRTAFLTRAGDDPLGQRVLLALTALGIERHLVERDALYPTGLFFRETPKDGSRRVVYYRKGSAASTMDAVDAMRLWGAEPPRAVIDPIGAGDAFLGGYLSGRLAGASPGAAAALAFDQASPRRQIGSVGG